MKTALVKRALKRDPSVPIGQPAAMHIDCGCGAKLDVPRPFTEEEVRCACGIVYNSSGWIQVDEKGGLERGWQVIR